MKVDMDSVGIAVGIAEDTPSLPQEASAVAEDFPRPPVGSTVAVVEVGAITPVAVITVAEDTMAVEDIMARVWVWRLCALTVMLLPYVIPRDSMTRTAFGMSIPVAQSPMATKASSGCGPSL
jgi:hypothetical protein